MRCFLLALVVACACAQRLENVVISPGLPRQHTISMRYLFQHSVTTTNPVTPRWGGPLEAQYQLPMSARVGYLFYNPPGAVGAGLTTDSISGPTAPTRIVQPAGSGYNDITVNDVRLDFDRPVTGVAINVLYQQPNLEINPFACVDAETVRTGSCRCLDGIGLRQYRSRPQTIVSVNGNSATFVPEIVDTYYEHAPAAGQSPWLRTFRRLCVSVNGGVSWLDTQTFLAVVLPCFATTVGLPADVAAEQPIHYNCASRSTSTVGLVGGVRLNAAANNVGTLGDIAGAPLQPEDLASLFGETPTMTADRINRRVCCGSNEPFTATGLQLQPGVCINSARTSCCGRRPFQPLEEQCCDRNSSSVRHVTQACPCLAVSNDFGQCKRNGPNVFDGTGRDQAGLTQATTGTDVCCGITKFGGAERQIQQFSFCVSSDPQAVRKCCSDGNVYDSSVQQCCPINGVQSLNIPCPCGSNTDCPSSRQACCTQLFPIPSPRDQIAQCDKFATYPRYIRRVGVVGSAASIHSWEDVIDTPPVPKEILRCAGNCYSLDYQICCNGRVCSGALERCCNDTCCNRYTSGCLEGRRPGSLTSRTNPRDWSVYYETCASVGALNGRKAFFVFILPTFMLFVTLLSLALVTVLARRATEHIFEMTERLLVALAVIETLLCCAFYFSPLYKNTVAVAFVSLAAILIAVARKTSASLFLVFLVLFMILYLVDPFNGNIWLGVTSNVPIRGAPSASSIPVAVAILFLAGDAACTQYYNNWFAVDWTLVDFQRNSNPRDLTWGFCSREWITTLAVFAVLLIVIMLLMLLLSVFSFVKKIAVKPVEPIELEVIPEPDVFAPGQVPFY